MKLTRKQFFAMVATLPVAAQDETVILQPQDSPLLKMAKSHPPSGTETFQWWESDFKEWRRRELTLNEYYKYKWDHPTAETFVDPEGTVWVAEAYAREKDAVILREIGTRYNEI